MPPTIIAPPTPRSSSPPAATALLDERELPGRLDDPLAAILAALAAQPDRRAAMAAAMRGMSRPQAAADVAALVWSLLSSQACRSRVAA